MAKLNENTEVALPLRNIISMVAAASLATWAYFGIIERLNQIETNLRQNGGNLKPIGTKLNQHEANLSQLEPT